jgi:2-polyprenyl-3-methyl-5-hydroxy-6-metoxy-1,4-benzoquinol methylase
MNDNSIKEFYNTIQFPGPYSLESFEVYREEIVNPHIKLIDKYASKSSNLIDIGCGTGFISNFLAIKYPNLEILGLDFAQSILFASYFARENNLQTDFILTNFLDFETNKKYEMVLCQGVLHHIPQFDMALKKLIDLTIPEGYLILGLYHPIGKILKKFITLDYKNTILERDQEENVYEQSYTKQEIVGKLNKDFDLIDQTPQNIGKHFILNPISFSVSGGLVTYVFRRKKYHE